MKPRQMLMRAPVAFAWRTLKSFGNNQGVLLAGAVAYYALLSLVPLLILTVIGLSRLVEQGEILGALGRYLEWLVPSQSRAVLADVADFLDNRVTIGVVLLATMLFFSSLTTAVVALFAMEVAAIILLLGAQVISEYERLRGQT